MISTGYSNTALADGNGAGAGSHSWCSMLLRLYTERELNDARKTVASLILEVGDVF